MHVIGVTRSNRRVVSRYVDDIDAVLESDAVDGASPGIELLWVIVADESHKGSCPDHARRRVASTCTG
jgi:hypothetical protein